MCLRLIVKYILFFVNLIFTLVGLGLIGLGVAALFYLDDIFDNILAQLNLNVKFLPYVIIGLGVFVFLVAFCGCCGSIVESKCLLITYAVIMGILAAGKIYIVVELLTQSNYFRKTVENVVNDSFGDPQSNHTFHVIEAMLQCCGTTGPDVYNITVAGVSYTPPTCCGSKINLEDIPGIIDNVIANPNLSDLCLLENSFKRGCTTLVGDFLETWIWNIGYVLIIIISVEVVGLIFATYISCTVKRKYY